MTREQVWAMTVQTALVRGWEIAIHRGLVEMVRDGGEPVFVTPDRWAVNVADEIVKQYDKRFGKVDQ